MQQFERASLDNMLGFSIDNRHFWVREGKSNQEIGDQLGISVLTVKNHVQKILRKLGASNRAQAVARAMSMNLLLRPSGEEGTVGR